MKLSRMAGIILGIGMAAASATADNRVEFVGRFADNQLGLAPCPGTGAGANACPLAATRPGEYIHATFIVTGPGQDLILPEDLVLHPNAQARQYDMLHGTYIVRASDAQFNVPVYGPLYDPGIPNSGTSPAFLFAHNYWTVDSIIVSDGVLTRAGTCCYPSGACTFVYQGNCFGTWSPAGACGPTNSCTQPLGVCCAPDNSCSVTLASACATAGGIWSAGGACTGENCPQLVGACCNPGGDCSITTQALCGATWTAGAVCDNTVCPIPAIAPDYGMNLDHLAHSPSTAFVSADISQNVGVFDGTDFWNGSRSWLLFFAYQNAPYEAFVDIQRMVISPANVAMGSCCPGDGHCLVTSQAACPIAASWQSGGACTASTCPSSSGACCKADGTCELLTPAACAGNANSVYMLDGSACTATTCPPTGGCCINGSCTEIIQSACLARGGSWMGAGTTCVIAPQYTSNLTTTAGACCSSANGACSIVYQTACTGTNTWTPGSTCATPCPNTGACCLPTGDCRIVTATNCSANQGTWTGELTCVNICPGSGSCCNVGSGSCSITLSTGCPSPQNTFTPGGACDTLCPSAGACCNTFDGSCTMRVQNSCAGNWTANTLCAATPCSNIGAVLPDAVFHSGQPDTPATSTFTQTISNPSIIQSVQVRLDISTTRINDLKVRLTGPNGTTIDLFTRLGAKAPACTATPIGAGHPMFGLYTFQDSAPQTFYDYTSALAAGAATVPGTYRPAGCGGTLMSFNAPSPAGFAGIPASGTWTLTVIDERSGVNTTLNSWSLSFNGGNAGPCTIGHCTTGSGCTQTTFSACTAMSGTWAVGPCSPTTCASGTPGACCFNGSCTVMCSSLCPTAAPNNAQFAGSGTTCTPTVCNTACCSPSGVCTLTTATNCTGNSFPLGTTCSPSPCQRACCGASGVCTFVLPASCTGTLGAIGSSCTPNNCPGQPAAPANNVCSTVAVSGPDVVLSGGTWSSSGATMVGATTDGVVPSCGAGAAPDVWYRFIPADTGAYLIQTCTSSSTWDTTVSVWTNCTTQLSGACADDTCGTSPTVGGHASTVQALTAGLPYLIRVGAYSPYITLNAYTLNVTAVGACCNSSGVCAYTTAASCTSPRLFQGLFTVCSPTPCPQPLACCAVNGTCSFVAPSFCASGNTVGPAGSTCSPVNQCQFAAACCFADGSCQFIVWTDCAAFGGVAQTSGLSCTPSPCVQPTGACCCGSHCSITLPNDCIGLNRSFAGTGVACTPFSFTAPCCRGNFNKSTTVPAVSVQDIFDFLTGYFSNDACADTNDSGATSVQDIFDFLTAYFGGGC